MDELLADFLTETSEGLTELDSALVRLERQPADAPTLAVVFRLVHTIKGTCGFLSLPRLEHVAHAAEDVLGRLRDGSLAVSPEVISAVLVGVDRIRAIVAEIRANGAEQAGDDRSVLAELAAIANGAAPGEQMPQPMSAEPAPAATASAGPQTIRVAVDVLEDMMTLVSELVLTRNQLLQLARGHSGIGDLAGLTQPLQRLSHITSDLQEGVMKTRLQPIGQAWNKLPRLVRDLGRELDKKIDLVMQGADTELDRQILELISDPLVHMVRNAADHGLESPAARRAAGKPELGRISLNAYHEGGYVVIEVADDGAGILLGPVRAKALASGLVSGPDLAAMGDADALRLVMRPGFSTASTVTATSGRGVGMDVVKANIDQIGGSIDLQTTAGRGTTVTIRIPLTLAIVSALIVAAGGERFALPQINVVELVQAQNAIAGEASIGPVVEHVGGAPVLRLRDRLLPLLDLSDLLQLGPPAASRSTSVVVIEITVVVIEITVVVIEVSGTMVGLVVDRVFDTEEIVVKPVAPLLRHITLFSGNTILGDGAVIMILDPAGIARAGGVAAVPLVDRRNVIPANLAPSTAMLLFRAGDQGAKAIPLALIARLEDLPQDRIEFAAGHPVTQYRGQLMKLLPICGRIDLTRARHSVLVLRDDEQHTPDARGGRCLGLVVDSILDVVDTSAAIEMMGDRPEFLGTAVIAGRSTDIVNVGHFLTQAHGDWFGERVAAGPSAMRPARILVVEDSEFFRQLLVSALGSAGYDVTVAASAGTALRRRDAGEQFDLLLSDIEMPDMDGITFARLLRAGGPWAGLPMVALSSHSGPDQMRQARQAGFTDYIAKFDRASLLASLRRCLAAHVIGESGLADPGLADPGLADSGADFAPCLAA